MMLWVQFRDKVACFLMIDRSAPEHVGNLRIWFVAGDARQQDAGVNVSVRGRTPQRITDLSLLGR
jgi:hypothetical protein